MKAKNIWEAMERDRQDIVGDDRPIPQEMKTYLNICRNIGARYLYPEEKAAMLDYAASCPRYNILVKAAAMERYIRANAAREAAEAKEKEAPLTTQSILRRLKDAVSRPTQKFLSLVIDLAWDAMPAPEPDLPAYRQGAPSSPPRIPEYKPGDRVPVRLRLPVGHIVVFRRVAGSERLIYEGMIRQTDRPAQEAFDIALAPDEPQGEHTLCMVWTREDMPGLSPEAFETISADAEQQAIQDYMGQVFAMDHQGWDVRLETFTVKE